MKESNIQKLVMLRASERGIILWRNNVGTGWAGNVTKGPRRAVDLWPGDVLIRNARPLHAGLCKGSSDLIGIKTVEITPDMVGDEIAVFTAVEVKKPSGHVSRDQRNFGDAVTAAGGRFVVARSPDDVEGI